MFENEGYVLIWIQENIRQDWLNPVMRFVTSLGNAGIVWIIAALVLLCFAKTRKAGAGCALALIFSLIVNNLILKNLVNRTRPFDAIPELSVLITKPTDASFPSGHTGSSIAVGLVILLMLPRKYGIPAMVLAVLISLSRLYVGVHYPTDVLGGAVSGIFCGLLAFAIIRFFCGKRSLGRPAGSAQAEK